MIEISHVSKKFDSILAVDDLTAHIEKGQVFGLVGTNGAGKSTLLRMLSGVLRPDTGSLTLDGKTIYNNSVVKQEICFLSDSGYYFPNATPADMADYYALLYPNFDRTRFDGFLKLLELDPRRKMNTFSKGMKKQVAVFLGIASGARCLLCDETFDGLDPVVRQAVKGIFAAEILDRDFTPVIASHNLRELEDICDHVGLLHKGRILLSEDLEDMKFHTQKVQCVLPNPVLERELLEDLEVVRTGRSGSLMTIVARGTGEEVMDKVNRRNPIYAEILPLSLEEIFISETEVAGYDIKDIFD